MERTISDYRQLAAYLNDCIKNEKAMQLLTGMTVASARDLKSISQLYRLLNIAFVVSYCKWLNRGESSARQGGAKHAINAVEVFELAYKVEPVTLDMVIYTMTEIKRDVLTNPNSLFKDLFSPMPREYSRYYGVLYEWKNRLSGSERDREKLFVLIKDLVTDMYFIKDIEVKSDNKKVYLHLNGEAYDLYDVLYEDTFGTWYFLKERFTYGANKHLIYINLDDYSELNRIVRY